MISWGENGLFGRVAREKGTVFRIGVYICFQEFEKRLEETEENSPGQRPVVVIVSPICAAL